MPKKYPQVMVPFTLDGEDLARKIMYNLHKENIVVTFDTANGADAWRDEMGIAEYL